MDENLCCTICGDHIDDRCGCHADELNSYTGIIINSAMCSTVDQSIIIEIARRMDNNIKAEMAIMIVDEPDLKSFVRSKVGELSESLRMYEDIRKYSLRGNSFIEQKMKWNKPRWQR